MNIFDCLQAFSSTQDPQQYIDKQYYYGQHILPLEEGIAHIASDKAIAFFGISDYRSIGISDPIEKPLLAFREAFYGLHCWHKSIAVYDGGNIKPGKIGKDTMVIVSEIIAYCRRQHIIPVFLGGTHDFTTAMAAFFKKHDRQMALCIVDAELDLNKDRKSFPIQHFLHDLIKKYAANINNIALTACQGYFMDVHTATVFNDLQYDVHRLGQLKADLSIMEPILRDTNALSFDVKAIQQGFIPSNGPRYINGLSAEEACSIMRYAGMSNHLEAVGMFDWYNLESGEMMVFAQMLWYFIEGLQLQHKELPSEHHSDMESYHCITKEGNTHISFLKSTRTGKWWMKVPYPRNPDGYVYVPCNTKDYQLALQGEVPDTWWRMLNKLA